MKPSSLLLFTGLVWALPVSGLRAQPEFREFGLSMWAGAGLAEAEAAFVPPRSADGRSRASMAIHQWYGLPELRPMYARVDARWIGATWVSAGVTALALDGYRRHVASIGLAGRAGAAWVGTTVRVVVARAGDVRTRRAVALAIKTGYAVSRRIDLALSVDPVLATAGSRVVGIESLFTVGLVWRASSDVLIVLDRTHARTDSPALALGLAWIAHPAFEVRLGATTWPAVRSVGIVVHRSTLALGILASHHDPLGWTTGIGMEWSW